MEENKRTCKCGLGYFVPKAGFIKFLCLRLLQLRRYPVRSINDHEVPRDVKNSHLINALERFGSGGGTQWADKSPQRLEFESIAASCIEINDSGSKITSQRAIQQVENR